MLFIIKPEKPISLHSKQLQYLLLVVIFPGHKVYKHKSFKSFYSSEKFIKWGVNNPSILF